LRVFGAPRRQKMLAGFESNVVTDDEPGTLSAFPHPSAA